MLNWLLRYQPVIRLLEGSRPGLVLDVGAGSHGLSMYWPGRVVQTDLVFGPTDVERVGSAVYVVANAESLPFADGAFDAAISVDMIEHLPPDIREQSVAELFRVARHAVVLAYPIGRVAARADRAFNRALYVMRIEQPIWLAEHLAQPEYPSADLVHAMLPAGWRISRIEREHNVWLQFVACIAELTPLIRVTQWVERWGRRHRLPQPLAIGGSYRWYFLAERTT